MWKFIKIVFAGCVFSFFYFPFEFTFLPGYNTKKVLAAIGCLIMMGRYVSSRDIMIQRNIASIIALSGAVSIVGIISNVYNATPDYVYATYVVSMFVWLSAAYTVVVLIQKVHCGISLKLVVDYLIGVCVIQCILAQLIDNIPSVKLFVDTYVEQGQVFLNEVDRIYGVGANLDVAGSRFAVALILIVCTLCSNSSSDTKWELLYVVSFIIIAILGSMIARTTYVGAIISAIYLIIQRRIIAINISIRRARILAICVAVLAVSIPIVVNLYNSGGEFYKMLRFAFEGFFNLAETGEWSIASNERLKTMYVFPDNLKTWIIGDGYFNNPTNVDPYYVGEITGGYYKGTDVGYLRFIFYFGLIGLGTFMLFFVKVAQYCIKEFPKSKWMFILLLLANFIIWLKVSTDIFLVFALFLCAGSIQNGSLKQKIVS